MKFLGISALLLHVLIITDALYLDDDQRQSCMTPLNNIGRCVSINDCPDLLWLQKRVPLSQQDSEFLNRSSCGKEGKESKVCCAVIVCGIDERQGPPMVPKKTIQGTGRPDGKIDGKIDGDSLLPSDCGRDLSLKIIGGSKMALDDFPWMALLEYETSAGIKTYCGGSLISKRYVLTAAHCLFPNIGEPISVRLGEYNTSAKIDCISDGPGQPKICSPDPLSVGIEAQILHEDYKSGAKNRWNDIALLRLAHDVPFSAYVAPLCLPTKASLPPKKLFIAGWGSTGNKSESDVKLKVQLPLVDREECNKIHERCSNPLDESQICAGGELEKDSCSGDSGNALVSVEKSRDGRLRWTAAGVVSFGSDPCSLPGWPGVYTNVHKFVPWIIRNMRA